MTETITVKDAPVDTTDKDAEAIAKVDAKEAELEAIRNPPKATEEGAADEGEMILGKFKTQDDLVKAYQELQRKMSSGSKEPEADASDAEATDSTDADAADDKDAATDAAESAGLDIDVLSDYYSEHGKLSDEHMASLNKAGITESTVAAYIAGQEALAEKAATAMYDEVGGKESFDAMIDWASQNMSADEIDEYNRATSSSDMTSIKNAVQGLAYKYSKAEGSEPKLINGSTTSAPTQGYESWAQATAAMKDPRYAKDPAYRAEVERKLANL